MIEKFPKYFERVKGTPSDVYYELKQASFLNLIVKWG